MNGINSLDNPTINGLRSLALDQLDTGHINTESLYLENIETNDIVIDDALILQSGASILANSKTISDIELSYLDNTSENIESRFIVNEGNISQNTYDISQNTYNISQNTYDISQNTYDISQNTYNIQQNAYDISQNINDISQNTYNISQNTYDISQNTYDISQNTYDISQNTYDISQNAYDISIIENNLADIDLDVASVETDIATLENKTQHMNASIGQTEFLTGLTYINSIICTGSLILQSTIPITFSGLGVQYQPFTNALYDKLYNMTTPSIDNTNFTIGSNILLDLSASLSLIWYGSSSYTFSQNAYFDYPVPGFFTDSYKFKAGKYTMSILFSFSNLNQIQRITSDLTIYGTTTGTLNIVRQGYYYDAAFSTILNCYYSISSIIFEIENDDDGYFDLTTTYHFKPNSGCEFKGQFFIQRHSVT